MVSTLIIVVVIALVVVAGLIALRLAIRAPKVYKGPEVGVYELAQLAGGRFRVANTALASLAARELIRTQRDGTLTRVAGASEEAVDPVEADILAMLDARPDGVMVWDVRAEVALRGSGVAGLVERLQELGLLEDEGTRLAPTRLGEAALAHYRLRHREERILPPRPRDRTSGGEFGLFGVALYGLSQMKDREVAGVLSLSSPPPRGPGWR
ncbi:TIGR04222 domain-containing membrane protein [Streptosporangium sp. NPDC087985]|uniref:TIGR04222 domain-containing membrane protein n=1 Tax=Streptosporangium sp. NPDC087985 TaxID=3366196 RepID=UPI00382B4219